MSQQTYDDAELRERLTPEQYAVTQQAGTERAFTGIYWDCHDDGTYRRYLRQRRRSGYGENCAYDRSSQRTRGQDGGYSERLSLCSDEREGVYDSRARIR